MKKQRLVLAAVISAVLSSPAAAQQSAQPPRDAGTHVWEVSGGLGFIGSEDFSGLLSLSTGVAGGEVVLRATESTEFTLFRPPRSASDIALLVGRRRGGGSTWARAAVGVGLVRSSWAGERKWCYFFFCDYEIERGTSIGLAVQAEAVWAPARAVGLGVTAFGNLNGDMSFAGLTFSLHLGRLR